MFQKRPIVVFSSLLLLLVFLFACGGGEELTAPAVEDQVIVRDEGPEDEADTAEAEPEPTAEVEPTAEPEPTPAPEPTIEPEPEPTAEAEPTAEVALADRVAVAESGFSFVPPAGYEVDLIEDGAQLTAEGADPDRGPAMSIFGGEFPNEMDANTLFEQYASQSEDFDTFERGDFLRTDVDGFVAEFTTSDGEEISAGQIVFLLGDGQGAIFSAVAPADIWEDQVAAAAAEVVQSIEFGEIAVDADSAEEANANNDSTADRTDDEVAAESEESTGSMGSSGTMPAVVTDDTPGVACFGASGEGLTCLSIDGEWQQYTTANSEIGGDYITALAACSGEILIAHLSGLSLFDGDAFVNISEGDYTSPDYLACNGQGGFWVGHFRGVSYYENGSWTLYDSSYLGDEDLVNGMAVDLDGNLWVLTSQKITRFDGNEWTVFDESSGLPDAYFFDSLQVDAAGTVYAAHGSGVLTYQAGEWRDIVSDTYLSPSAAAVDSGGNIWLGELSDGLARFDGTGWSAISLAEENQTSDRVRGLATDGNGRLWAATTYGLNVWDGNAFTTYRMDNSGLLSNELSALVVIDGGPTLPEQIERDTGGITGKLTAGEDALVDILVEVCVESFLVVFLETLHVMANHYSSRQPQIVMVSSLFRICRQVGTY